MIAPRNNSLEPMDDDGLLPSEDDLSDLADDLGWSPEAETPIEDDD